MYLYFMMYLYFTSRAAALPRPWAGWLPRSRQRNAKNLFDLVKPTQKVILKGCGGRAEGSEFTLGTISYC